MRLVQEVGNFMEEIRNEDENTPAGDNEAPADAPVEPAADAPAEPAADAPAAPETPAAEGGEEKAGDAAA